MENFDMSQFKTEEEMAQEEQQKMEQEILKNYDRMLYCEDPNRILEVVQNVFMTAQELNPENKFYECTDTCIKWSINQLATNPAQLVIVEGLLSHRLQAGLLAGMFEDNTEVPFKALPANSPVLKNTAFLGRIANEKAVTDIKENVIKVARIPVDTEENMRVFMEPLNPAVPNMLGYCIALINLTDLQMSNLKKASKLKKVSDKTNKIVENLNTTGYALTKTALEGVVSPAMQTGFRIGGLAAGTMGVATFKSAATAVNEITGAIARADVLHSQEVNEIKANCAQIAMQLRSGKSKDDSFSFTF